jgi:hypothetical protein
MMMVDRNAVQGAGEVGSRGRSHHHALRSLINYEKAGSKLLKADNEIG